MRMFLSGNSHLNANGLLCVTSHLLPRTFNLRIHRSMWVVCKCPLSFFASFFLQKCIRSNTITPLFTQLCSHRIVHLSEHGPVLFEHGPSVCVKTGTLMGGHICFVLDKGLLLYDYHTEYTKDAHMAQSRLSSFPRITSQKPEDSVHY